MTDILFGFEEREKWENWRKSRNKAPWRRSVKAHPPLRKERNTQSIGVLVARGIAKKMTTSLDHLPKRFGTLIIAISKTTIITLLDPLKKVKIATDKLNLARKYSLSDLVTLRCHTVLEKEGTRQIYRTDHHRDVSKSGGKKSWKDEWGRKQPSGLVRLATLRLTWLKLGKHVGQKKERKEAQWTNLSSIDGDTAQEWKCSAAQRMHERRKGWIGW